MRASFFTLLICLGLSGALMAQDNSSPRPFYHQLNATLASNVQGRENIQPVVYHYSEWSVGADGRVKRSRAYMNGRRNRNAGIGLLIGGAVCLTGGVAMLTDGVIGLKRTSLYSSNAGLSEVGHLYEIYFGSIFTAAGLGMVIPGAILLPKGTKQMRRAQERMANP